jgi:hypothetical protein
MPCPQVKAILVCFQQCPLIIGRIIDEEIRDFKAIFSGARVRDDLARIIHKQLTGMVQTADSM